ncbi:DUF1488 domain-containing protein [Pseudoalteromonas luteoviolacea]|uniref:DUF1488 domain-containing protein n=1 Tax=Pseudoalteromonas luteoviolacea H33 TaxID=1365251 RepID=A0A167GAK7_9GAMM|nr:MULTISPECIES: DUF1488 domain-containing protein [Pseudoalteromonas]KZN54821.1 hypothetical protein N476_07375 [Pseudoalteromonas luteoviolacea H33]KZN77097.1 hypothetical protein N477_13370 [Pseudoalteromonas luteoviolacea H33-S]MBQ4879790.1 DUF1488 domain-containing protein [Pseudoalteromonas luteoviolacea]MBQ4908852.1 DUF1488 domain-containing protein [Pseudoalteromonas luteoviolacea]MCF6442010.1 DUF1488 domain-containing protein [Pseudoalteromonas luteoviolacea]
MNQAVLFNDDIHYDVALSRLVFTAMVSGMIVPCVIAVPATLEEPLVHFRNHQFDYEMQAEELIEDESYSASGEIELTFL